MTLYLETEIKLEQHWIERIASSANISEDFDPVGFSVRIISAHWNKWGDESRISSSELLDLEDIVEDFGRYLAQKKSQELTFSDLENIKIYAVEKIFLAKYETFRIYDRKVLAQYIALWLIRNFRSDTHESFNKALEVNLKRCLEPIAEKCGTDINEAVAMFRGEIDTQLLSQNLDDTFLNLIDKMVRAIAPTRANEIMRQIGGITEDFITTSEEKSEEIDDKNNKENNV